MKLQQLLFVIPIFFFCSTLKAQEVSSLVLDRQTGKAIPYATVMYSGNKGVVTNEEGRFSIHSEGAVIDTLFISSLGYEAVKIPFSAVPSEIFLKYRSIELKEVFLTNKNLTGKEIIKLVKDGVATNYNFDLTQKRFFFRESRFHFVERFDLKVDKSTIEGIDQKLMSEITANVPKYSDSYKEVLGDLYGNYDHQKIAITKAANLHNPQSTAGLTELTDQLGELFRQNIKEKSYLKIRSGIIGFKMDARELEEEMKEEKEEKAESTAAEKAMQLAESKKSLQKRAEKNINRLLQNMFWREDITLNLFDKTNRYRFSVDGYAYLGNEPVYVISFQPKRGDGYLGKMYVNTLDYGVHRLDYENVKPLKKFRLLGISTSDDLYRGKMIFFKDENGKYNPQYIEQERGDRVGVDRPLTIIEKNKTVPGRRKQNELDLDIRINISQRDKYQLVVYENVPLEELPFQEFTPSQTFEYRTFKKYDPEFWSGYNIIEPNAAIQKFTTLNSDEEESL